MNYYFAYGLTIASNIDFPELYVIPPTQKPDVLVNIGNIPAHLPVNENGNQVNIHITATEYFLFVNDAGSFYAVNGNEVIIEPIANADMKVVRIFFLSNAMTAILYQRKLVPIHAAAIYDANGIVLFLGDSGAGKSTTTATLQAKGYRVFSDDVCVPIKNADGLSAFAAYPMMKLWKDSFEKANIGRYQEEDRLRPDLDKYGKLFNESFITEARPIKKIFILEKSDTDVFQYMPVKGIEAFKYLQNYAYRYQYIEIMGVTKAYFDIISALSNQIPIFVITRPSQEDTLSRVIELIESNLEEKL